MPTSTPAGLVAAVAPATAEMGPAIIMNSVPLTAVMRCTAVTGMTMMRTGTLILQTVTVDIAGITLARFMNIAPRIVTMKFGAMIPQTTMPTDVQTTMTTTVAEMRPIAAIVMTMTAMGILILLTVTVDIAGITLARFMNIAPKIAIMSTGVVML